MKKILVIILILVTIAFLGVFAAEADFESVDSLIRPPKIEGDNSQIQAAFESSVGERYILKSPLTGEHKSSFTKTDLDSDGSDEVIVFYCQSDSVDTVRMNILDENNGEWTTIADLESTHSDVHSVSFANIDNDDAPEIIISWQTFENELFNNLDVYKLETAKDEKTIQNIFSKSYNEFLICDVDGDDKTDILIFEKNTGNTVSEIRGTLYDFNDETASVKGEFIVDPSISSIGAVCYDLDSNNSNFRIFIDGYKTDTGVTTDLVRWDRNRESFVHEETFDFTSFSVLASRNKNVYCSDINNDSVIEIPLEDYIPQSVIYDGNSENNKMQDVIKWVQYSYGETEVVNYELINSEYDYSIMLNGDYFDSLTVKNDLESGVITFYSITYNDFFEKEKKNKKKEEPPEVESNNEYRGEYIVGDKLFSVFATADQDFGMYELSGYRFIKTDNGFSYYYQIFDAGKELGITKESIKSIIIT